MSFNNYQACKYDENISFGEIKSQIKESVLFKETTDSNVLRHRVDFMDEYSSDSLNFIYGKYGYEFETKSSDVKITDEKIIDVGDIFVKSDAVSFWIADNHMILFSLKNMKAKNNFAENILGDESLIQNRTFNI